MDPIERRPKRFPDRGSVAVLIVAICLSVAGLGAAFFVRQQNERSDRSSSKPEATTSLFAPGVRALEVISKIAEPRDPLWASEGARDQGAAAGTAGTTSNVASADSTRNRANAPIEQLPDQPAEGYTPLSAPVTAPESTTWVPVIALAPVASTPSIPTNPNASAAPSNQAPTPAAASEPVASADVPTASTSAEPRTAATANSGQPQVPAIECGSTRCAPGLVCCNASCGTCARPGETCSQQVCGMATAPTSTPCGLNTCNVGEFCCNPYCGICATTQAECDSTATCMSPVQYPQSVSCGMVTCNTGFVCCNPSCGICAPYGEPCSQDTCG